MSVSLSLSFSLPIFLLASLSLCLSACLCLRLMRLQFETNTTGLLSGQPVFPCVDSIASQEYDDMTNDDDGILLVSPLMTRRTTSHR